MPRPKKQRSSRSRPQPGSPEQTRDLTEDETTELPTVELRSPPSGPFVFKKMVRRLPARSRPGDLVSLRLGDGQVFGFGLFNPRSKIVVRVLQQGVARPTPRFWERRLREAVGLRHGLLRLPEMTDAYRLVHAEADGLSGLVVDRLENVLSAEAFSLGMWQRGPALLQSLAKLVGVPHARLRMDETVELQEGILTKPWSTPECPSTVNIREAGTRFQLSWEAMHKTGFFCDQRENRLRLAEFCPGRSLLDLCCHLGGFALQAKCRGQAREVIAVDLDEAALQWAGKNAGLNQVRIDFQHADIFDFLRRMIEARRQFDVVVLDPPKLIRNRREMEAGRKKYFDMNRLAIQAVKQGGLLLTCSCSGLLSRDDFSWLVSSAASAAGDTKGRSGSRLQVLAATGAAADHPVAPHCRETEYLKALWLRAPSAKG